MHSNGVSAAVILETAAVNQEKRISNTFPYTEFILLLLIISSLQSTAFDLFFSLRNFSLVELLKSKI